jgi:wyosine [tRNA(Phe)-imidazoG37] synthetase (radical SAM superfamily)
MEYRHLFGPVNSRRIGLSLGVDLVPHKVCCFNCVYCECGPTTEFTAERGEYEPIFRVIEELKDFLGSKPTLDYITFSGAGEPLLNKGIGGVIKYIKQNYPNYKIALFTNSALLCREEVRQEVLQCDLLLPSLDAVSRKVFKAINRPVENISALDIVTGLCKLRKAFQGRMWLEVFMVPGLNDGPQELDLLSKAAERIKADKVQLNFLDRPGSEAWVRRPTQDELKKYLGFFKRIKAELVPRKIAGRHVFATREGMAANILNIVKRRPCTAEDIAEATGVNIHEVNKYIDVLIEKNQIVFKTEERGVFFMVKAQG